MYLRNQNFYNIKSHSAEMASVCSINSVSRKTLSILLFFDNYSLLQFGWSILFCLVFFFGQFIWIFIWFLYFKKCHFEVLKYLKHVCPPSHKLTYVLYILYWYWLQSILYLWLSNCLIRSIRYLLHFFPFVFNLLYLFSNILVKIV